MVKDRKQNLRMSQFANGQNDEVADDDKEESDHSAKLGVNKQQNKN